MSADVGEQVRQLAVAFDEFVGEASVEDPPVAAARGSRFILAAAAVLLVAGLLGTLVWMERGGSGSVDPAALPADAPPTSDDGVLSPLMQLRTRLVNRADTEMFVVDATAESYWRLSTLADFDGSVWGIPETELRPIEGELSTTGDGAVEIRQTIRIVDLGGFLVPAAAEPIDATGSDVLRWSPDASLLVRINGVLESGDTYEIVSAAPRFDEDDLRVATSGDVDDPIHLELPDDFPSAVGDLAREVTADATTPYESARALQDWFRTEFEYSLEVQSGHDNTAMESFVDQRVGFAEQFAGTYAAMMRSLGIPARVAVGFTPGEANSDGGTSVFGRNAHAWPEVWFDDLGWVPFEPTPGRSSPGAENHTGLAS